MYFVNGKEVSPEYFESQKTKFCVGEVITEYTTNGVKNIHYECGILLEEHRDVELLWES